MKTMLKQNSQSRLEARDGVLCIVVETPFSAGASEASSPGMRQWFRVEEPDANPALVAGRPVRNLDPKRGYSSTKRGTAIDWRVAATPSPITLRSFQSKVGRVRGWRGRCADADQTA